MRGILSPTNSQPQLGHQPVSRSIVDKGELKPSGLLYRVLPAVLTLLLALGSGLLVSAPALADEQTVPEPLSLQQALEFAKQHPRVLAETSGHHEAPALSLPRPQPLYLGCHSLAFSGARESDAARDVAWSPLLDAEASQRLEIMQRFFDVLLADLSFARDNEAMAVAYIQFDRAEARGELGQYSALQIAELEATYQMILRQRAAAETAQRITRALLANALGHPQSLPRDLQTPDLSDNQQELPMLDAALARALKENPRLKQLMDGRSDAEQALVRMAVRERLLELLARLDLLEVVARQARVEADWRDLKLDESRTLYELEAASDLGYSMSQQTKARRDARKTAFCSYLLRAELNALQGGAP
jgi:hypothetical protein